MSPDYKARARERAEKDYLRAEEEAEVKKKAAKAVAGNSSGPRM
jgi:hypothetical protein